jgi:hypothetical protein
LRTEFLTLKNKKDEIGIVVTNTSPKVIVGSLREIHVSITGEPNDYAIEVDSGEGFGSLLIPGVAGLLI